LISTPDSKKQPIASQAKHLKILDTTEKLPACQKPKIIVRPAHFAPALPISLEGIFLCFAILGSVIKGRRIEK